MHLLLFLLFCFLTRDRLVQAQTAPSAGCSTFLRPVVCGIPLNDTRAVDANNCPLMNVTAVGTGVPFDAFWYFQGQGPLTYCILDVATRTYNIPQWLQSSLTSVVSLATFTGGVDYRAESQITAITQDGTEHRLGSFIPNINTVAGGGTSFDGPAEEGYPFNGQLICNKGVSTQTWPIAPSLTSLGVVQIKVYDPRQALRIHALTVTNCTGLPSLSATASVTINSTNAVDSNAQFIATSQVPSWPLCALAAQRNAAEAFSYTPNTGRCSVLNTTRFVTRGETANTPLTTGVLGRNGRVFTAPRGIAGRVGSSMDTWSMLRSDLFGDLTPRLFMLFNTPGQRTIPRLTLWAQGVSRYAVAASQMVQWRTQAFLTVTAGGLVTTCGNSTGSQNELLSPFYYNNMNTNTYCDSFSHCRPVEQSIFTGPLMVDLSTWPNRTACRSQAGSILVYMDGAMGGGSTYSYVFYTTSQYSSYGAAVSSLGSRHEQPTVHRYESFAMPSMGGYAHFYNLVGPERQLASPDWKMTDVNGRTVNTTLWCDAYDVPHYEGAYRVVPTGAGGSCGAYGTLEAITLACNADASCMGFTVVQNISGFELPGCLFTDVGSTVADDGTSLFIKRAVQPTCTFPTLGGLRITVRVTSSVDASTVYEVLADSAVVGSCSGLPTDTVGDSACYASYVCFTGDIPQGTTNVVVRAITPMRPQRRCDRSTLGVSLAFDAEYNFYSPPASCLTAVPIVTGCASSAVVDPCGASTLLRGDIALATSACAVTADEGLASDAGVVSNLTVGVVVVVDASGVDAASKATGVMQVLMETDDGSTVNLGHMMGLPAGGMKHFGPDQTPIDSYALCVGTIPQTETAANAHYFAVPIGIRRKAPRRIIIRGLGARVVALYAAGAGCEAPNPMKAADVMFGNNIPFMVPSAPTVASDQAVSDYGACGMLCYATSNCVVYSFSNGQCSLHNALGTDLADGVSRMTGVRMLQSAALTSYAPAMVPSSNIATLLHSLSSLPSEDQYANVYAFVAEMTWPLRLAVEGGQRVRAILSQGVMGSSGAVSVAYPGVGGGLTCGKARTPWEGIVAGASQCGLLSSCGVLNSRVGVTGTLQVSWLNPPAGANACGSNMWGLIATSGSISGGAHYFYVRKNPTGGSPVIGAVTSVATGEFTAMVDGTPFDFTSVEQYLSPTAITVGTAVPSLCRITQKAIFKVRHAATPLATGECATGESVREAMATCGASDSCEGISVDASTGAFLCYATDTKTNTSTTDHFMEKVLETSCTFDLTVPGMLTVSVAQLNLFYAAGNDVKIYINNRLLGRCGNTEPFVNGYDEGSGSNCSNYLTCVDALVPETGTLRVVLPSAQIACGGHYGSVLVELAPAAPESRNLHRGAATLAYRRIINTRNPGTAGLLVSSTSQAAVLVRQDRYRCGVGCEIPSQLNLTVGSALQRLCGGLSGFEEGIGLNNECDTYYYCGTTSGGNPVSFTPITTELTFTVGGSYRTTTACDRMFHSVVYSNGLMLAADATHFATRTVFARRYSGVSNAATFASATADLRAYSSIVHPSMPAESFDSLRVYDKAFPIYTNLLTVTSSGYVLYDFADVNEADKVVHNGTYACVGDKFTVDGKQVVCQMRFSTNYISVAVAQTKYDTIADTITVITRNQTKICGGDRSFFGNRGTLDECNRFYTCFEGYIAPMELVTIVYSNNVIQNSRCRPSALALVTGSTRPDVPDLLCTDPAFPVKCYPSRQCMALSQVCNRFVDCADQSDEADCTAWSFIAKDISPTCAPLAHAAGIQTVDDCRRFSVADLERPNVFTVNTSGCFTYTCVSFSSPNLQSLPPIGGTELHALVINPSDFGYCSDQLHCSGHGTVQSINAPCVCTCDGNYVGGDCASITTPSIAGQLVVVFDRNATVTSNLLDMVETSVLASLPSLYTAVVSAVEDREEFYGVFMTIRNTVHSLITSDQLVDLLANSTQEAILRRIKFAGAKYLTVTQLATPRTQFVCRRDAIANSRVCSGVLQSTINSTRSLTVTVPGIAITNATSQWVDVTLATVGSSRRRGATKAFRCAPSNAIVSTDYSQTGDCTPTSTCMFPLADGEFTEAASVTVEMSPGLNPSDVVCFNAIGTVSAVVDGRTFLHDDALSSYDPVNSSDYKGAYLYAFFALLGIGLICLVIAVTWCRLRKGYPRLAFVGPLAGALTLFLITFSIVLLMYYFDSIEDKYTHSLVIEDYRDPMCEGSPYAPSPVRAGIIPGDGDCHEVRFVGQTEESVFIGAQLSANREYPIAIRYGLSFDSCSGAAWEPIFPRQCHAENTLFPSKASRDLQWYSLRGMAKAEATDRLAEVRALNPTAQANIEVPVAILPPEYRYLSQEGKATFLHKGLSYAMEKPHRPELTLVASAVGDPYLTSNVMPLEEVRFIQRVWSRGSFVDSGGWVNVDDPPTGTGSIYSNMGTLFSSLLTRSDPNAFISTQGGGTEAFVYSGVSDGPFDLSTRADDFTLSLWVRCPSSVRGVAFAVTDGWLGEDASNPIVERLIASIENGDLGPDWFSEWTVGSALYLNGGNGRIALASASPSAGVQLLEWNAYNLGVERLFDGKWHYVAFSVAITKAGQMSVRLYVDGEHRVGKNGWTACAEDFFQPLRFVVTGQLVTVTSQGAVVTPDGILGVGYLAGGVFGLTIHDYALTQQQLFQIGTESMQYFSEIMVNESLALGICTAIITGVIVLYSIYVAFRNEFGVNEDEFEEEALYDERGHRIRQNTDVREDKGSMFTTSVSFVNFALPVILLFQIITLFIQSFDWPAGYYDYFYVLAVFSLDLDAFNVAAPILLWPILQFAIALVLFVVMMVLSRIDQDRFVTVTEVYREKVRLRLQEARTRQRKADDAIEMMDLPRPNYEWVVHGDHGTKPLTPEQQENLTRSLQEILQQRARRETNMRVFTRNLVNMGDLGTGIILYERIAGNVYISLRTSPNTLAHDQQADVINMKQTYFEQVCSNVECPEHKTRLLPDDLHASTCVHSNNLYYRSKECPRKCIMYKCPDPHCEYAVCEFCYTSGGSAVSGAVSDALKRLKAVREAGVVRSLGTAVALLWGLIYIPAVKNALMIISCHKRYRCEFDNCWENPSAYFMIMVLISVLVLTCVAVGYICIEVWILKERRERILQLLPQQTRKPRNKVYDFIMPNKTIYRGDYNDFLDEDKSILSSLYTSYEFDYFYASPALIFYRFVLVVFVACPPEGSLSQLGLATAISLLFALVLVLVSMYKNVWVEGIARLGAIHILVQLALMSLHRVDIRDNIFSAGYDDQMVAVTFLYIGIVGVLLIITVVVPFIRLQWSNRERRKKQMLNANEQMYDIGFWGEIRNYNEK